MAGHCSAKPLLGLIFLCYHLLSVSTSVASQQPAVQPNFDLVVAKDGSGDFTAITEAINAAPSNSKRRFYIKIGSGVYNENVVVGNDKVNITFVGDGMDWTVLRAANSMAKGFKTFETATLAIHGGDFVAIGLTVENVADDNSQAVALMGNADRIAFFKCRFVGYQDTVYPNSQTQFFKDCEVYGSIDFILGNARVVFQDCSILVRTPFISANEPYLSVTAQSRENVTGDEGTVFQRCTFQAASSDFPSSVTVFLGRPWGVYARVVVMESFLGYVIDPEGWMEWDGAPGRDETATFLEYDNVGPGADTSLRVKWPGYKRVNDLLEANMYTVRNFIKGDEWIPQTGIPVTLDLDLSGSLQVSEASFRAFARLEFVVVSCIVILGSM